MGKKAREVDRTLLGLVVALVVTGFFIFSSASLGLLARGTVSVSSIAANHLALGLGLGTLSLIILSRLDFRLWQKFAPHLFAASLILTALVFIPGIGFSSGGATRWIHVGSFSLQPSEALKLGAVLFAAYYFTKYRNHITTLQWGIGGFLAIIAIPGILLLLQPDTGTFAVLAAGCAAIFFAAGARWRDILIISTSGVLLLVVLFLTRPYVHDRIMTFIYPEQDQEGTSYHLKQSLIAIGSGHIFGRGFGQSIQKFEYLPEPVNDAIFAVAAEEFGFAGASLLVLLFFGLVARSLWLATRVQHIFGALLMVGIASYIGAQSFINMGAMLGIFPLTGIPLVFVSQGGTALLIALSAIGILLNVSRHASK